MNTRNHNTLQYVVKTVLLFVCIFSANSFCFAHSDSSYEKKIGNVEMNITTGYKYEEVNQAFILGSYAQLLSKELNYRGPIRIHYNHSYIRSIPSLYYVSVGNTTKPLNGTGKTDKKPSDKRILYIWISASSLNITEAINIVEFAIKNKRKIKANQFAHCVSTDLDYWKIGMDSYSQDSLLTISKKKPSEKVSRVIAQKIERPRFDLPDCFRANYGISYYCSNDSIHVFAKRYNKKDSLLLTVKDVFWYEELECDRTVLLFDTDCTFYVAGFKQNDSSKPYISERKVITNRTDKYEPYEAKLVDNDKIFITYRVSFRDVVKFENGGSVTSGKRNSTTFYNMKDDRLIIDFDKFIKANQ